MTGRTSRRAGLAGALVVAGAVAIGPCLALAQTDQPPSTNAPQPHQHKHQHKTAEQQQQQQQQQQTTNDGQSTTAPAQGRGDKQQ